jgi:hypothetical protein
MNANVVGKLVIDRVVNAPSEEDLRSAISKNRAILAKSIVHTQQARFSFFSLASWRSWRDLLVFFLGLVRLFRAKASRLGVEHKAELKLSARWLPPISKETNSSRGFFDWLPGLPSAADCFD